MATYEQVQGYLDRRYQNIQKKMDDIVINAEGSPEDAEAFVNAMQEMSFAIFAVNQQTKIKHSLSKSILDGIQ